MEELLEKLLAKLFEKAGSSAGDELAQLIMECLTGGGDNQQLINALTAINNEIGKLQEQITDLPAMISYNSAYNTIIEQNSTLTDIIFSINTQTNSLELKPLTELTMQNYMAMSNAIARASSETDYFTLSNDIFITAYGVSIDTCLEQSNPENVPYFSMDCALSDMNKQTLTHTSSGELVDFNQYFQNLMFVNAFTVMAVGAYIATVQQAYFMLKEADTQGVLESLFASDKEDLGFILSNINNAQIGTDLSLPAGVSTITTAIYQQILPYMLSGVKMVATPTLYNIYNDFTMNGNAYVYLSNLARANAGHSSYCNGKISQGTDNAGYSEDPITCNLVNVNFNNNDAGNSHANMGFYLNSSDLNELWCYQVAMDPELSLGIKINPSASDNTCQFNIQLVMKEGNICLTFLNTRSNYAIVNCIAHYLFSSDPEYVYIYELDPTDSDHCWLPTYSGKQ